MGFFFPSLALINRYYLGDTILLTGIAESLSKEYDTKVYIVSNYSELLNHHPYALPRTFDQLDELPKGCRIIDMSESIKSIRVEEYIGKDNVAIPRQIPMEDKLGRMYEQAGCYQRYIPRLYLNDTERQIASDFKQTYGGRLIGLGIGSRHDFKVWAYYEVLAEYLAKKNNVFLIDNSRDRLSKYRQYPIINLCDLPLRELMASISIMDLVISNDSAVAHLALALGVPAIVLGFDIWANLYDDYTNATFISSNVANLKSISVKQVTDASKKYLEPIKIEKPSLIKRIIHRNSKSIAVSDTPKRNEVLPNSVKSVAFVRIRGLGDVLLTLPALKAFREKYPDKKITYITGKGLVGILELTGLIDECIGVVYDHETFGYPSPPAGIDYKQFDRVYNLINRVDFEGESYTIPRIEMFGNLMNIGSAKLENVNIDLPQEWIDDITSILASNGVSEDDTKIVLQVDSKGLSRQWKRIRQVEFCRLAINKGYKVILISDKEYENYPSETINLTGKINLKQLFALIKVANMVVAPDSSGIHIAGVLGTKAIGLFGSISPNLRITHYESVRAIVGKAKCVPCNDWQRGPCESSKNLQCMDSILARDVFLEVEKTLKEAKIGNSILQSIQ